MMQNRGCLKQNDVDQSKISQKISHENLHLSAEI